MSISNYTELVAELGERLDRDDLSTRAGTFIQLTEARLNRLLQDPEMEVVAEATASGAFTTLPDDFGEMVSVSTGDGPLLASGSVEFSGFDTSITGIPRHYVIQDGSIGFWPGNFTAVIRMVYRQRIPALTSDNPTNWLLTLAPDVYLYGSLIQAFMWDHDDERAAVWKDAYDEAIVELKQYGDRRKWGAAPIGPRIRRA